jgi:hypothetical protein
VNDSLTHVFKSTISLPVLYPAHHFSLFLATGSVNSTQVATHFIRAYQPNTTVFPPPLKKHFPQLTMTPPSQLSKSDVRLFLQQLQTNPADITRWNPFLRISLLRVD